jgi:cyanophycinase
MEKLESDWHFSSAVVPNGLLVAIGGNEDKEQDLYVLRRVVELCKKSPAIIEIITTASEIPEQMEKMYSKAFLKIGNTKFQFIHIRNRKQAEEKEYLKRIQEADIIFFTGGDQLRITSVLGGTTFLNTIIQKYFKEKCIVAGTSAGATAMSQTMIYDGGASEALLKGNVKLTAGIGLINNVIIDSHFIIRGRFGRLMEVITSNPSYLGIGLGEDTGIVIRNGCLIEIIGNGLVVLFEGGQIHHSNITTIKLGEAIAVEGMLVHTLVNGYGYNLKTRHIIKPSDWKILIKKQNENN